MIRHLVGIACLSVGLSGFADSSPSPQSDPQAALFSSDGYRIDRYRSPTPAKAMGAQTVSTDDMLALLQNEPTLVVIDVINLEYRADRFLLTEPHQSLPSATWLPNTGRGNLDSHWNSYLIDNALRLTHHNRNHPVVVLCKSDCWLSWNATKRLSEAGFTKLYWYKDGVDSWANAGLPMQPATPVAPEFPSDPVSES
ncbi:rhodanese-like domain-containing protein [Marinobacter zhejiangensis]|uniref:PQQ-dependent catabolism-associated CXXCW motif protein n=1 Tax=Marinobacter zhejiangensis TaxID=488535 RepID=A0A1I4SGX4_9GAMM|nr:rhodanese-like domain-containing protein [Marinobacter zhejiangensis]SFM63736.1 PQQ-dependent catabolism-associated CXXCW motif protein [Marinobacter zhejiangensis]